MKRRYWLLPPLLGLAGYFSADAVISAEESSKASENKSRTGARAERPVFTMEQALEEYDAARHAEPQVMIEEVPDEALKQRLLDLKKTRDALSPEDAEFYPQQEYYEMEYRRVAYELVKRMQGEGVAWIEKELPDLRLIAMQAWATAAPEEAWQAIIHSKRQPPCDPYTLMEALKNRAKANDGTLKQACLEVPWELFTYCDSFKIGLRVDPQMGLNELLSFNNLDDLEPWIESGTARALAGQGLDLHGFFATWSNTDAPAALRAWSDWPQASQHGSDFVAILAADADKDSPSEKIMKILEGYSPEQRAQAAAAVLKREREDDPFATDLRMYYPALGIPTAESE